MGLTRLIVVRHGNTFKSSDIVRRIGARFDLPLTDEGKSQARRVASWLQRLDITPDCILTGPLQRAKQTAAIIAASLPRNLTPVDVPWLNEIDYGPDDGKPETEVVRRVGRDSLDAWDKFGKPAPGWLVDRDKMIIECRSKLTNLDEGSTVLVTSNGIARFILLALGLCPAIGSFKLRTGCIGYIDIVEDKVNLIGWDIFP